MDDLLGSEKQFCQRLKCSLVVGATAANGGEYQGILGGLR